MRKQIVDLREAMRVNGMDAYLAFVSDYHASEYVSDYFKTLEYLSGFTGSSGVLAVTMNEAALFTDGRYFLQAEQELAGSGVILMRMEEEGVLTLEEYLYALLPQNGVIGVDGRTLRGTAAFSLLHALRDKNIGLSYEKDIVDGLWPGRPKLPRQRVFALGEQYTGKPACEKLYELRQFMEAQDVCAHLLTALDDIAWLFNIRGGDIRYTPLALAYVIIEKERVLFFTDEERLCEDVREALNALGAAIAPYGAVYDAIKAYGARDRILISKESVNYTLCRLVEERAVAVDAANPTTYSKALKNTVEQQNLFSAHIKDGVAMAKLLYWLKTHEGALTEMDVANKIDALRLAQQGCIGPSFATIAGYKEHAAIVHYKPAKETAALLGEDGLLLLDSGGQYYEGTTDVTRTVALGPLTQEEKRHFTLVLKGMLALSGCVFLHGCSGGNLDILARAPLWKEKLDYKHGTGHGIGYMLCVHEPPAGIRWKRSSMVLEPGMVLSCEPGVYIAGSHGVRIENQLLVQKDVRNMYGEYLHFETLTRVPIDLNAVDIELMTHAERAQLNAYHACVYEAVAPHLDEAERDWLKHAVREI